MLAAIPWTLRKIPFMPTSLPLRTPARVSGWLSLGQRMTDSGSAIPAEIDLDQPQQGIQLAPSEAAAAHLIGLAVRSGSLLVEHWVRGDDVTAVYESADARRLRTTAMWRAYPSSGVTRAWELVASAQTSLLQSDSALAVVSEIDATDILYGTGNAGKVLWHPAPSPEATCVLVKRANTTGMSVLIAAHPGDAKRMNVRREGPRATVECWLFSTVVEKGVLLRSRVLAAIGPTANARDWASDLLDAFAASPPILTT